MDPAHTESRETLEGRLLAQRKVLARIVAVLARGDHDRDVLDWLRERAHARLQEEDPGAVPDAGFAIEGALADEIGRVLALAEAELTRRSEDPGP